MANYLGLINCLRGLKTIRLYILTLDKHELYNSKLDNNSHVKSLKRKFPSTSDAYVWHLRLGHINSNRIKRLIKDGLLELMDF